MRKSLTVGGIVAVCVLFAAWGGGITVAAQRASTGTSVRGFVPRTFLQGAVPRSGAAGLHGPSRTPQPFAAATPPNRIDSVVRWSDSFVADGFDVNGNPQSIWPYTMVGNAPESNRAATINAPVIPVVVQLLDANGHALAVDDPTSIVAPTMHSPIFEPFSYTSGSGQFTDQMQRASFWNRFVHFGPLDDALGWHTTLVSSLKQSRVMRLPAGSWLAALNPDGSCCAFIEVDENTFLNELFPTTVPVDNSTVIGAAELAGDMTPSDIASLLFHNVVLFENGDPQGGCCVIGFHSYDLEPGDHSNGNRQRRFVMNFSSWIDPGLFLFGFSDVTPLSHELAETFNDPFGENLTPWWLSADPFVQGSAECQPVLETGDVVEVLDSLSPTFAASHAGRTYHLQNEAMFPWFAEQTPSTAHLQAYSFPDETVVTALSPHPLLPGCAPALGAPAAGGFR